jgi:hypothetical protein
MAVSLTCLPTFGLSLGQGSQRKIPRPLNLFEFNFNMALAAKASLRLAFQ